MSALIAGWWAALWPNLVADFLWGCPALALAVWHLDRRAKARHHTLLGEWRTEHAARRAAERAEETPT